MWERGTTFVGHVHKLTEVGTCTNVRNSSYKITFPHAGPPGAAGVGGLSFIRWGRTTCPTTAGTQLLYTGKVVGSDHRRGGSAEYTCLHNDPQFLQTTPGLQLRRTQLYGTEYEFLDTPPALGNLLRHDVPCSLCYTPTRTAKITIPARTSCPPSWTREYYGYYMSEAQYTNHKTKTPVCMDVNAEPLPGTSGHNVKSVIHFMEVTCVGIQCPPYSNGAEITCVVCTK
jgi:hypothetical protein